MHSRTQTADVIWTAVPSLTAQAGEPSPVEQLSGWTGVESSSAPKTTGAGGNKQTLSGRRGRGGFAVPSVNTFSSDDVTLLGAARRPLQASSSSSSSSSWRFPTTLLLRASSENFCPLDSGRPSGDPLLVLQESSCSSSSSSSSSPSASSSSSCWSSLACWEYCFSAPQRDTNSELCTNLCLLWQIVQLKADPEERWGTHSGGNPEQKSVSRGRQSQQWRPATGGREGGRGQHPSVLRQTKGFFFISSKWGFSPEKYEEIGNKNHS